MEHKDINGQLIEVGDEVACAFGGTYVLFKGVVSKINKKTVSVCRDKSSYNVWHRYPDCVVVLTKGKQNVT